MNLNQTTAFIEEAERRLRIIRNGILVCRQEGRFTVLDITSEIIGLREKARELSLGSVIPVLDALAVESEPFFTGGRIPTDADTYNLLDRVAHAEAEIIQLKFSHDDTNFSDFVEESFETLRFCAADDPESVADEPAEEPDEFEPDAEMLEIFSMEADELLANIESNLELLSSSPGNRDALWEVRRHAHTFKGAAGIIGLKKPSKLAHRIEDLLDHLAQNDIVPDNRVLELITSAASCLREITRADAPEAADALTAEVYKAFDETMARLTAGPTDEAQPAAAEPVERIVASSAVEVDSKEAVSDSAPPRRPIVRVSIERLDNLVQVVRDLVISRSAIEQRVANFDAQLEALTKTTRRLQAANAKIENDFEASMLGSFAPAPFLRTPAFHDGLADETPETEGFDALEFDRYTDFHQSSRELSEAIQECFAIGTSLEALKGTLEAVIEDQRRLIEETQDKVMQIRLIRFESIAARLQRAVRVTCEEEHKKVEILLENQDVELDTDILDSLVEPLMHLIRNAVVHGIEPPDTRRLLGKPETGRITVRVANQETHIELKVSDDGRGIAGTALRQRALESGMIAEANAQAADGGALISLLAIPGLTTAEKLTMSAGRGVGMGIVKESVEARNGTLSVETAVQQGTTFTIRMPLAFAVTQVLLVRSVNSLSAVPFKFVKRVLEISSEDFKEDATGISVEVDHMRLPVHYLADQFAMKRNGTDPLNALLVEAGDTCFVLVVDEVLRTEEIAVKPLGKPLDKIAGVLGAAILGNGEIVPVLDVSHFQTVRPPERAEPAVIEASPARSLVLIVDDSPSVRHITSKVITAAGLNVITAKDGVDALEILGGPDLPDVILTDVEMPRMDGYELAAAVRNDPVLGRIPLVFVTSRAGEKHRERAAELGVSEYLTKPFIESELLSTVERLSAVPVEALI